MVHAFFNPAQAAVFNALAAKTDSTFEIKYFGIHGLAHNSRILLALSGAKFTSDIPEDWASEKPNAPFGVMPLLTETSADGKHTLHVSESEAIERYLARKFGFLGKDAFEEVLVNTFITNDNSLMNQLFAKYLIVKDVEVKAANKESLITDNIAPWIKNHEQHLKANGANGHYVGNKITLADVKTNFVISLIQSITGDDLISESKTPSLWEVRKQLDKAEGLAAWKATEDYKTLSEKNFAVLGFY
ncbi:MAG: hypothetical protein J3R72DRAFT_494835 [Linnemannia gamsii]|nr:MAG: hypothetical protein J3R72DRAFT_494835 [Linnemannia gamsii]